MPQELGSDQWFTWQYIDCIKKQLKSSKCITNDLGTLLNVMGDLFSLSSMNATEPTTAKIVKNLQAKGFKVTLLTSRGPTYRNATERELKNNGFNMLDHSIGPKGGFASTYIPYDLTKLSLSGLTQRDAKDVKLGGARKMSYMNGIMMTAGLHKGIMLKSILHKVKESYKGIIFADDHIKHTIGMQKIMGNTKGTELVTFRYGHIDPQVKAFKESNKKSVVDAYNQFNKMRKAVFK